MHLKVKIIFSLIAFFLPVLITSKVINLGFDFQSQLFVNGQGSRHLFDLFGGDDALDHGGANVGSGTHGGGGDAGNQ